jgi:ubiquitin-protein ligase
MFGGPPDVYSVFFHGRGLCVPDGTNEVHMRHRHEVMIRLGASYPRMMPELVWKTPVFHPNISANGVVCLGGYSTHWVPSLQLDELCTMLWDMIRYENYDVESPYNRQAAQWVQEQTTFAFPIDNRAIRNRAAEALSDPLERDDEPVRPSTPRAVSPFAAVTPKDFDSGHSPELPDIIFVDDEGIEVVDAEIVDEEGERWETRDILFIE